MGMHPPEKIMAAFFSCRLFEAMYVGALGVHGSQHVPAGAIFAGRINPLQNDQQGMFALGIKFLLQVRDAGGLLIKMLLRIFFRLITTVEIRIHISEADF